MLQPAAREHLEISGGIREVLDAEAPGGAVERMGRTIQRLRRCGIEAAFELRQGLMHRLDTTPQPGDEFGADFSKGIGGGHLQSSQTSRASSPG